jgi:hypothetical protein
MDLLLLVVYVGFVLVWLFYWQWWDDKGDP